MQACFVRESGTVKTVPYEHIDKRNSAFRFDDIDKRNGAFRFEDIDKHNSAFRFEDIDRHNGAFRFDHIDRHNSAFRFPVGNGLDRSVVGDLAKEQWYRGRFAARCKRASYE